MGVLNFVFFLATLRDVLGETVYLVPVRSYESVRPDLSFERRNFERRSYLDYGSRKENFGRGGDEFGYNEWTPSSGKEYAARGYEVYGRSQGRNEDFYRRSDTYPNFQLNDNSEEDYNFDIQESIAPNRRQPVKNLNARFGHYRDVDSDRRIPAHNPQIERHSENTQRKPNSSSHDYNMNNNDDRYHSNKQNERELNKKRQKYNHNEQIQQNNNNRKLFISKKNPEPHKKGLSNAKSLGRDGTMDDEVNWVWGTDPESETTTDSLGDRFALAGDKCPTGMIRVGGKCVQPV